MTGLDAIASRVGDLWQATGPVDLTTCPVSGNNRVYVASDGTRRAVVKLYFASADGDRRLDAEWSFVSHVWNLGLRSVPQPVARDRGERLALYGFVEGHKLQAEEIGAEQVRAAADFIAAINQPAAAAAAALLHPAREAGFSIAEHLAGVERRMGRLDAISSEDDLDAQAADLVGEMRRGWTELRRRVEAGAGALGLALDTPVPPSERLLSPSDFGFHNILLRPDGSLAFLDFEYAGWDDVAKLSADFFYQPAIPVGRDHVEAFLAPILAQMPASDGVRRRIALLQPLFGLRWCCIMLNCFLADMQQRVTFADPMCNVRGRKSEQLSKARRAFRILEMS
jgi:hypothetical protein